MDQEALMELVESTLGPGPPPQWPAGEPADASPPPPPPLVSRPPARSPASVPAVADACAWRWSDNAWSLEPERPAPVVINGCYHGARILHRSRRLGDCSSVVEGFNSVAEWLSSKRQTRDTSTLSNMLLLALSGVTAIGGADEEFVAAVARRLGPLDPFMATGRRKTAGKPYKTILSARAAGGRKFQWGSACFDSLPADARQSKSKGHLKEALALPGEQRRRSRGQDADARADVRLDVAEIRSHCWSIVLFLSVSLTKNGPASPPLAMPSTACAHTSWPQLYRSWSKLVRAHISLCLDKRICLDKPILAYIPGCC